MDCKCRMVESGFPPVYDNTACPTHGPTAPRYYVDHETIHDRITGKHVEISEAVHLLNGKAN